MELKDRINPPVTKDQILAAMKPAKRYDAYQLSMRLNTDSETVRAMLKELENDGLLMSAKDVSHLKYFLPQENMAPVASFRTLKPYRPGPEWHRVRERVADFRSIKSLFNQGERVE